MEEAARASGSGAYAGPVTDDEPIVIEDDEPAVGTKEKLIVILKTMSDTNLTQALNST